MDVPVAAKIFEGLTPYLSASACWRGSYPYKLGPLISRSPISTPSSLSGKFIRPLVARLNRDCEQVLAHTMYSELLSVILVCPCASRTNKPGYPRALLPR